MTDRRIAEVRDERQSGGDYFVYLRPGFRLEDAHCFGAIDRKEIRATMSRVQKCTCEECAKLTANPH